MAPRQAKIQVPTQGRALRTLPLSKPVYYRSSDAKYVGEEPEWPDLETQLAWTESERRLALAAAFKWYGYTQDIKASRGWVYEFFSHMPRFNATIKALRRVSDDELSITSGWLCRMGRRGLKLNHHELKRILRTVTKSASRAMPAPVEAAIIPFKPVVNIQQRMTEKMHDCMAEIDAAYDEFAAAEYKTPAGIMKLVNALTPPPARVKDMVAQIQRRVDELEQVVIGKDPQLVEAYKNYGKRQVKAMLAWWRQAITDLNSYGNIKKTQRKVRTKKAASPEKLVARVKYLKTSTELGVTSISPVEILRSSEVWVYNVKKRKLGVYIADAQVSALGVKGAGIIGFDPVVSVQKTLRKPAEQLKALLAAGKPASKKWFKDIKSTEIKLNGRLGEDWIIVKAYK